MEIKHILTDTFLKWKNNCLTQELRENVTTILEPTVLNLIDKKTYTLKEKAEIEKESERINDIIDKHLTSINTRYTE